MRTGIPIGLLTAQPSLESVESLVFQAKWNDKSWLNTPGPFYGANTDSCGTGPIHAPYNSGLDREDLEYIFKQPSNVEELRDVVTAAKVNVLSGYGCDGDSHWTMVLIQEWWERRQQLLQVCLGSKFLSIDLASSPDPLARVYRRNARYRLQYVRTELADYLGAYSFFIEEGRLPNESDTMPIYTW
jgi:hypothetical protein